MPTAPTQIISLIRFQLAQMKVQNAHHDFEHLCRHLARLRVYSNIIPATGPVSAGGDGGRDFETFRTALSWPLTYESSFIERSSGTRAVAFACSLEAEIETKIRADVRSILSKGVVDEVVHFCEADLAVSKRHALQRWAKSDHGVILQIFNGQAIAELLADRETIWIAHEYLRLPAELTRPSVAGDDGYQSLLARWREREPIIVNHADFLEIKWALRHATSDLDARPDLVFWIRKMEAFLGDPAPRTLRRSASYEIAVATLRGKGELDSQVDRVRDFMSDFEAFKGVVELQDTATLLVYVFGAWALGHVHFDQSEIFGWRKQLIDCLDQEIAAPIGPGRRSGLLRVRGYICILPEAPGHEPPIDDTFIHWNRMIDDAEQSPQFPIEDFADHLSRVTAVYGEHARFSSLAERADGLLAKRSGPAAAADKIFDRALSFYQQTKLLEAIRELHRVQLSWFTGDTMARFQKAIYLLSQCYLELRCAYASKYYALAGAYIARYADDPEVKASLPRMLFAAADADDRAGNSLSFVALLTQALGTHILFEGNPLDTAKHPDIQVQLEQTSALRGLALRESPKYAALLDEFLKFWPEPIRSPVVQASKDPGGFWATGSMDEAWKTLQDSFLGRPFGDVGRMRAIAWRALGIKWSMSFNNTYAASPRFERLAAEMQVALVTLAAIDLCLLPVAVHFELSFARKAMKVKAIRSRASAGDVDMRFSVALPPTLPNALPEEDGRRALRIILQIIRHCSVLPDADLSAKLTLPLKAAAGRIFAGRPYEELYCEFMPKELFIGTQRRAVRVFGDDRAFNTPEHPLLAWFDGPGPTYSADVARDAVLGRYRRGMTCARFTVERLMKDESARSHLAQLHCAGIKDWEVLSIIANAVANDRVKIKSGRPTQEDLQRFQAVLEIPEQPEQALDPAAFTASFITFRQQLFQAAFLSGWGLALFTELVPFRGLKAFLVARYGLRSDDEEHPDVFGWTARETASVDTMISQALVHDPSPMKAVRP